ncbi:hypothetical protein QQX09_01060 [Demequina sp. SYSU T00192]|uniref:Uncharacterized protein n=1 Tax=Demequina litoralis TaxID=3051660 RepID=A0ABT8G5M9_9MICO|nr:hypothetical protein [Demequina sp. SYSU T00192]MDN4474438.1 hypothetical protein [Demequina sp. SYSU T00192]
MTRGVAIRVGVGVLAALAVVALAVLGPWWSRDLPVMEATVGDADRELTVLLGDACGLDPSRTVVETDTEVRVRAFAKAPLIELWSTDCQVALTVGFAAPLGDRALVDEATGEQVEVTGRGA